MSSFINTASGAWATWNVFKLVTTPGAFSIPAHPWRPQEWIQQAQTAAARTILSDGTSTYVFDAVIRAEHNKTLRVTEHPVQNGANISDHAFMLPARVSLEIGMSDAMDSFFSGQFSGEASRSVSAYKTLIDLQMKRIPLTLTTRLGIYKNMIIEQIVSPDNFKTMYGLKAIVNLRQIMTAQIQTTKVSARKQASQTTNTGPKQATTPTPQQGSVLSRIEEGVLQ